MQKSEALELMKKDSLTLVLYNSTEVFKSKERGVAPLLALLESGRDLSGFFAVDKVVGAAAAFLYVALNVKELHALTMSESARDLLLSHSVAVTYDMLVPRILNRAGNGYCPMESAVLNETDAQKAIEKIKETRRTLRENKKSLP